MPQSRHTKTRLPRSFVLCASIALAACSGDDTDQSGSVRAALSDAPARSCAVDTDCNDGSACSVDRCVTGRCVNDRRSDDTTWALPIAPGREVSLGGGSTVLDVEFDGEFFLVVWIESSGAVRARRVTSSGIPVDVTPWTLPEGTARLAFDGTNYMAMRNVIYGPTGSNLVEVGTISKEGAIGPFAAVDLYCRNSNTGCYGADIAYGGGAFIVLYKDAGWRDLSYALYDRTGAMIQRVPLTQWFYQGIGGSNPRAVFDGTRFVVTWADYRDLTNAASIYATKIEPNGGNQPLANQVGLFVNPGDDDLLASGAPTPTAGKTTYLVTFNGFRDPNQVRLIDPNLNVNPEKVTGVGEQNDLNTRESFFDGKNYVVSSRTCTNSIYCYWANFGVYVSRLTESGALIDKSPVSIGLDGRYPRFATNGHGKNIVAYERWGSIQSRSFETCP